MAMWVGKEVVESASEKAKDTLVTHKDIFSDGNVKVRELGYYLFLGSLWIYFSSPYIWGKSCTWEQTALHSPKCFEMLN